MTKAETLNALKGLWDRPNPQFQLELRLAVMADLLDGMRTKDAAAKHKISADRVSRIRQEAKYDLAVHAKIEAALAGEYVPAEMLRLGRKWGVSARTIAQAGEVWRQGEWAVRQVAMGDTSNHRHLGQLAPDFLARVLAVYDGRDLSEQLSQPAAAAE